MNKKYLSLYVMYITVIVLPEMTAVQLKFSKEMLEAIDMTVKIGQAVNRSDFIRRAVAEKLAELTVTSEMKKRKL